MTTTLRVPRSRGALSGLLLALLGLWGALAPLVGPYFHFGFAPDKAWDFTSGRIWLQVFPGAAVFLGGLMALASHNRAFAAFGAWIAALGGAWFAVGVPVSGLWADQNRNRLGTPLGDSTRQVTEQITLLFGLGVVVVFLAAVALGRFAVVGVKDARLAEERAETADTEGDLSGLEPNPGPRPPLARRSTGAVGSGSNWPEEVPATPADPRGPRTTSTSDVKVAGKAGDEKTADPA